MGGARAEYKLNIAGSVARRRREIFEIIHLGNMISFAKTMLLERFRNVPQAILYIKITNFVIRKVVPLWILEKIRPAAENP